MTSQSPRIYLYKITFEEVPYYYYGVHKEKYFNEEYWGSPVTHKWCWDFYTPKQQILQFFDFTDEGWIEAQEVEKRLIRLFYNTDKWCLNENCGGKISLETSRKNGKIVGKLWGKKGGKISGRLAYELGLGIHAFTPEQRTEISKKSGKISGEKHKENGTGVCGFTFKERSEIGKKYGKLGGKRAKELKVGIHGITKEERIKYSQIAGNKCKELNVGVCSLPLEKRIEYGKMGAEKTKELGLGIFAFTTEQLRENAKKTNSQKWMCLETGFITTSGPLTRFQRKRGIDTSKRKRIE